jgi:hypothetical protein
MQADFRQRRYSVLALLIFLSSTLFTTVYGQSQNEARRVLDRAIAAQGGFDRLNSIKLVKVTGIGQVNLLEQSERPEGPWAVMYEQFTEWRDYKRIAFRRELEQKSPAVGLTDWTKSTTIVADVIVAAERGGKFGPAPFSALQEAEEKMAFSPERLLLTASSANDLKLEKDQTLQGTSSKVLAWKWKDTTARLFLNQETGLPTAVEFTRARPFDTFWSVWGDLRERVYYSNWDIEKNGLRYPHQLDIERIGLPLTSFSVLEVEFNPAEPAGSFDIPENARKAIASRPTFTINDLPLGRPGSAPVEIGRDTVQIQGFWNTAVVRQHDGLVIIESPLSSGYSAKVIDAARGRFPNLPVKAVISTSDAWPHLGGMREYVSRRIPAYVLDLNLPIAQRLISAHFDTTPDALARKPEKAIIRTVASKTVIGSGVERLEVFPVRGEIAERMMVVYFPSSKALYASDIVQRSSNGDFFNVEALSEVVDLVKREKLDVNTVFAMHSGPIAYADIVKAVDTRMSAK